MSENTEEKKDKELKERAESAPRDTGTIHVSEHLKIHDPNNGEVFLNKRDS